MITATTALTVLAGLATVFVAYTLLVPAVVNTPGYMRRREVMCPHKQMHGDVRVHPLLAGITGLYSRPRLRVAACTLLGRGGHCDEACLRDLRE